MSVPKFNLSSLLHPNMIWLDVPDEPIETIGKRFVEMSLPYMKYKPEQKEEMINEIISALVERQKIGSTAVGQGIAYLESCWFKEEWLEKNSPPIFGIGISKNGIFWRTANQPPGTITSLDENPVHIFLYTFVCDKNPERRPTLIKIYAYFDRAVKDKSMREELLACKTSEQVINIFRTAGNY